MLKEVIVNITIKDLNLEKFTNMFMPRFKLFFTVILGYTVKIHRKQSYNI